MQFKEWLIFVLVNGGYNPVNVRGALALVVRGGHDVRAYRWFPVNTDQVSW
jgi:hypothetical protein